MSQISNYYEKLFFMVKKKQINLLISCNKLGQNKNSKPKIKMEQQISRKSEVWSQVIEQESIFNPISQMHINLEEKYMLSFNFFLSKPINQIVYQLTSCSVTQAFMDSRYLAHEAEFLKRPYRLFTQQQNEEIYQRIRMLGEFYNMDDKRWKYEYPTMIITDTKSIFEKRHRRLKKIIAGQGSSDQTEQKQSFYCYSFETQHFLKDLSNISRIYNNQKKQDDEESLDSEVHNVYSKESYISKKIDLLQISIDQLQRPLNIFKVQQKMDHLICDFQHQHLRDLDHQKKFLLPEKENQKSHLTSQNSRKPLKNFNISSVYQQSNILQESGNQNNNPKNTSFINSYLNLYNNKYRKIYLDENNSTFNNTEPKSFDQQNLNNEKFDLNKIDKMIQNQKEQKNKNRKKIREKAEELLRKVRGSSQIN